MQNLISEDIIRASLGGILIGLSSGLFYLICGRISGISGIFIDGFFKKDHFWRLIYVFGLVASGVIYFKMPYTEPIAFNVSAPQLIISGLIVGFGVRLGNGCTSGHGICGISRLSMRSILAVLVFMFTAIITTFIKLHVWGQ